MAAPKGNKYYQLAKNPGAKKTFETPRELWDAAVEYFEWCDENPWYRNEAAKAGDHFGENVKIATARPYTFGGLCIFLDIDEQTFANYRKREGYEEFFGIANKISRIIDTQQFEGAVVGCFKENIIARKLGLVDKTDNNVNIDLPQLTPEQIDKLIDKL